MKAYPSKNFSKKEYKRISRKEAKSNLIKCNLSLTHNKPMSTYNYQDKHNDNLNHENDKQLGCKNNRKGNM